MKEEHYEVHNEELSDLCKKVWIGPVGFDDKALIFNADSGKIDLDGVNNMIVSPDVKYRIAEWLRSNRSVIGGKLVKERE